MESAFLFFGLSKSSVFYDMRFFLKTIFCNFRV